MFLSFVSLVIPVRSAKLSADNAFTFFKGTLSRLEILHFDGRHHFKTDIVAKNDESKVIQT